MTSPEVNEVFKRNSHLYHGDVTVTQLPVPAIVAPVILTEDQLKEDQSFEWPGNNEGEGKVLYLYIQYIYVHFTQ